MARVSEVAQALAENDGRPVTTSDLILALLDEGHGVAVALLEGCGVDPSELARLVRAEGGDGSG
ncbi:MAG: Clp protease N-terminal domain-containing protein [Nitriliruptor sp.]|uniref:Clp protease N-terminal domain-containing protein n=1 Tax=Nitriliruptor sp. TaxID=2448056 RepID=UPI0034A0174D